MSKVSKLICYCTIAYLAGQAYDLNFLELLGAMFTFGVLLGVAEVVTEDVAPRLKRRMRRHA